MKGMVASVPGFYRLLWTFLLGREPERRRVRYQFCQTLGFWAIAAKVNSSCEPRIIVRPLANRTALRHYERKTGPTNATQDIPSVADERRLEVRHLDQNIHIITLRYGFMDHPNIPRALAQSRDSSSGEGAPDPLFSKLRTSSTGP
jgi:K+ transporter